MSIERSREVIRTCPRKVAKAQVPKIIYSSFYEVPSVTYEIPDGADIACEADCPGAKLVQKKLGPIPLPFKVEVCPAEESLVADGHSLSMSGQPEV